jgi:hypothetical protein
MDVVVYKACRISKNASEKYEHCLSILIAIIFHERVYHVPGLEVR